MVVDTYRRIAEDGKWVDVQIWKDDRGNITKIRHTTYWESDGEILKFRSDITSDCKEFQDAIRKERRALLRQVEILRTQAKELEEQIKRFGANAPVITEEAPKNSKAVRDERLGETARILKEGKMPVFK